MPECRRRNCTNNFRQSWAIESIQAVQVEVIPNLKDFTFSEGGPKAWFAVIRRVN